MASRGRPKGSKNKPRDEQPETESIEGQGAGPGHNGGDVWTPEELVALAFHYKARILGAEAAKKQATKDAKDAYTAAERLGVDKAALKQLVALNTPEGQVKAQAELEARQVAQRWNDFGVGEQDDLFAEDRTPLVDKAYAAGKVAAMNGEDCVAPYEPGSEQGQAWIRGWQDGQVIMASMIKKLEAPAPIFDAADVLPSEGQDEGGLSDEEIDAAIPPAADAPPSAGDDLEIPEFLRRTPGDRVPAEVD